MLHFGSDASLQDLLFLFVARNSILSFRMPCRHIYMRIFNVFQECKCDECFKASLDRQPFFCYVHMSATGLTASNCRAESHVSGRRVSIRVLPRWCVWVVAICVHGGVLVISIILWHISHAHACVHICSRMMSGIICVCACVGLHAHISARDTCACLNRNAAQDR